jgi:ATP-dependent DNA helicase RecG
VCPGNVWGLAPNLSHQQKGSIHPPPAPIYPPEKKKKGQAPNAPKRPVSGVTFEGAQQVTDQAILQYKDKFFQNLMGPIDSMVKVVDFCKEPKYLKDIMVFLNYKHRPTFVKKILKPLLDKRLIKMTIPGKPTSQHQKYVAVMKEKSK